MVGAKTPAWLEVFKLAIELFRVLAWPALVVGAFFVFRQPIETIAQELPLKFVAATKVGVGSLVLEIQQQAKAAGNPQLATRLGRLTPDTIKHLIEMGDSHMIVIGSGPPDRDGMQTFSFPDERRMKAARELAKNGLVEFKEDLDSFLRWIESDRFRFESSQGGSRRTFAPVTPLTDIELDRLKSQYYQLNELGRRAWQAVLDAVLEQLRAPVAAIDDSTAPLDAGKGQ